MTGLLFLCPLLGELSIAGHGNFSFTMNRYVHGRERAAMQAGVKFEGLLNQAEQIQPFVQVGA